MKKLLQLPEKAGKYVISAGAQVKIYFRSLRSYLIFKIERINGPRNIVNDEIKLGKNEINCLIKDCRKIADIADNPRCRELRGTKIHLLIEDRGSKSGGYAGRNRFEFELSDFLRALQRSAQDN